MTKKQFSKFPLAVLITGLLIYPLGSISLPNIDIIPVIIIRIIPYITAIVFVIISIVNIRKYKKSILFWIGAALHLIYVVIVPTFIIIFTIGMSNFD